jgi:predicted ABC-type ATPase
MQKNFAFETTAAGTNYVKYLQNARQIGYEINLMYLWLSSPDLAVKRVGHRVTEDGHHVPEEVVRRRLKAGLKNIIHHCLPLADTALTRQLREEFFTFTSARMNCQKKFS